MNEESASQSAEATPVAAGQPSEQQPTEQPAEDGVVESIEDGQGTDAGSVPMAMDSDQSNQPSTQTVEVSFAHRNRRTVLSC